MMIVTALNGQSERIVTVQSGLERARRVNGEKELSFSLLRSDIDTLGFDLVQEESTILFQDEKYIIKNLKETGRGDRTYKTVSAVHEFFPHMIDQYKHETTSGTKTFAQLLSFVFSGSGYSYQLISSFDSEEVENFGNDNRLALFQNLLERFGAEFEVVGTTIRIMQKIGADTDFQFRYNFNVKTLSRTVDTKNLTTYVKGFGQPLTNSEGTPTGNYVVQGEYFSPNVAYYGVREAKPVSDDRVTSMTTLNKLMKAAIQDTPELSIELDFVDLRAAGYPYVVPNEGDRVLLIYEPMNLQIVVRLVEVVETFDFYLRPVATKVTLANMNKKITDTVASLNSTQKTVNKVVNKDGTVKTDILGEDVKNATKAVKSAQTEIQFNNGLRAVDPSNPNHIVVFTSAGIGISEDGGNTYKAALTGDGAVADVLTSGILNTNNVRIQGDTNFFWDGGALVAQDPLNANKFLKISKNGIQITTDGGSTFQTAVDANGVVADALKSNGSINITNDARIGNNLYLGENMQDSNKEIRFNDSGFLQYDTALDSLVIGAYNNIQMLTDVIHHQPTYRTGTETGHCGVGGFDPVGVTSAVAGVYVQFKHQRISAPTSITLTGTSSNATPVAIDITADGFWLYVNGTGVVSYKYWRGTYTTVN